MPAKAPLETNAAARPGMTARQWLRLVLIGLGTSVVPLDSAVPHDANGVVADAFGTSGPAQTICVGCHSAAGSDAAHTPSANGHDEVYTPVP